MRRIEKLNPRQVKLLTQKRDEWLAIGLSTERADWAATREAIEDGYRAVGKTPPKLFLHFAGPLHALVARSVLDQVSDQVLDQVSDQVLDQVSDQVRAQWQCPNFWGSQDGWWWCLSWYETMRDLGVEAARRLDPWFAASRVVGWCWLYWDVAIVSDRPTVIARDDRNRLHCGSGPAVAYGDGTEVWAWHGVRVPRRLIEQPQSYTAAEYKALPAEQRRALGEHAGWSHILQMLGSTSVDTTTADGLSYELVRCGDGSQYLRMQSPVLQDGSQPHYLEPVHEGLNTAAGARKWRVARDPSGRWWTPKECDKDPSLSLGQHT